MSYDAEFYRRRERQEREIARCSIDPEIAAIHLAMAERYAELAAMPADEAVMRSSRTARASFAERSVA